MPWWAWVLCGAATASVVLVVWWIRTVKESLDEMGQM